MSFGTRISSMIRATINRGSCLLILITYTSSFVMLPAPLVSGHGSFKQEHVGSASQERQSCSCACRTRGDGVCRCDCCNQAAICTCGFSSGPEQWTFFIPVKDATLPASSALALPVLFGRNVSQFPSRLNSPVLQVPTPPPQS